MQKLEGMLSLGPGEAQQRDSPGRPKAFSLPAAVAWGGGGRFKFMQLEEGDDRQAASHKVVG